MINFEKFFFNCLFGLVIPIFCFLIFRWGSLLFTNKDSDIFIYSACGLGAGIIVSLVLKLILKPDIYRLPKPILVITYLFYNVGLFGFFMGVPVFHLILGVIAGFYWSKHLIYNNILTDLKAEISRISLFTSIVLAFVCLFSATIALMSKSTPSDLKGMLHLPFDISQTLLISFILIGGLFLILTQYFLTRTIMSKILKVNRITIS